MNWQLGRTAIRVFAGFGFLFLIAPLFVIVPLSFNAEPYFTFRAEMLTFEEGAYSLRWYQALWSDSQWHNALLNSFFIGICATLLATTLGTFAAVALNNADFPLRRSVQLILISPLVIPIIIVGVGVFFFYATPWIGLTQTYLGIILSHAMLGAPFVVITVTATLANFNPTLMHAAASLGANALTRFRRIQLPLITPGVVTGGLFAFATSFDEVVVVLFMGGLEQRTLPRQMWSGIREDINPTILAVATLLIVFAVLVLMLAEWLRSRSSEQLSTNPD